MYQEKQLLYVKDMLKCPDMSFLQVFCFYFQTRNDWTTFVLNNTFDKKFKVKRKNEQITKKTSVNKNMANIP